MNYPHDKNYNFYRPKQIGWKKPVGMGIVILFIYLWGSTALVDATSFIVYPYLKITGQINGNFVDALKNTKIILSENKKLQAENARLKAENLQLNNLKGENNQLRGLQGAGEIGSNPILSLVIFKPNHLPHDEIVIDTGSDQVPGLKSGRLVFADKEVVLGQIEYVTDEYSKVKLYSSGGVKIPVVVGDLLVPSIAEGLGSGNFSLTLPRGVEIKVGDHVKTSIVGSYILGYVAEVVKDSNDPFQKIIFRSPYNVFELEWVQLKT